MADLTIESREEGAVAHLALSGEFDLAGITRFNDALRAAEESAPDVVVVDLNGLQFMDSSGLRALVTADDRLRKAGRRLAIVPGPPMVRRVFEITQLDSRLELVDDADAVSAG